MRNYKYILSIETSCDDTSVALLRDRSVLSNVIYSQSVHQFYQGVVPELASRDHQKKIIPTIDHALALAKMKIKQVHAIAYTVGPGLIGSLLVGSSVAKSLALSLNIPLIEVHHMQAHLLVHFIKGAHKKEPTFPFLGVTLSGGHTQIAIIKDVFTFQEIGTTLDDAIGECFDKCGTLLGFDYPSGHLIDQLSQKGNPDRFQFPLPSTPKFHLSYSGLKTAFKNFVLKNINEDEGFIKNNKADLCASLQKVMIEHLTHKIKDAVTKTGLKQIVFGGGVSCNRFLFKHCHHLFDSSEYRLFFPPKQYTTDNAAMIGIAGYFKLQKGIIGNLNTTPKAKLNLAHS
ncbi:MAG: tRNA (adenosine(37)-N6)-threonylcarbamoyltransferase complex transferase subunit TsaD [Flavobacteriaceae bacterium]|nr:tRNA (adenosine(37)-N6)-threonylcarbamoyltransferase complex transferase subunit TsaD [Flavobacteriaceae bacterium]MCY4266299.1 tRNA (adenosine(37)-N6)-threonylcarbamoyltransferase complex transferase subunit TsaD [Flavobacteriaceae bacterium]